MDAALSNTDRIACGCFFLHFVQILVTRRIRRRFHNTVVQNFVRQLETVALAPSPLFKLVLVLKFMTENTCRFVPRASHRRHTNLVAVAVPSRRQPRKFHFQSRSVFQRQIADFFQLGRAFDDFRQDFTHAFFAGARPSQFEIIVLSFTETQNVLGRIVRIFFDFNGILCAERPFEVAQRK